MKLIIVMAILAVATALPSYPAKPSMVTNQHSADEDLERIISSVFLPLSANREIPPNPSELSSTGLIIQESNPPSTSVASGHGSENGNYRHACMVKDFPLPYILQMSHQNHRYNLLQNRPLLG